MMNLLIVIIASTGPGGVGAAAPPDEAALALLDRANRVFQEARAIHYYGSYTRTKFEPTADAPYSFTVAGAVWMERLADDDLLGWKLATWSSTGFRSEPPLMRATYDGAMVALIYPSASRVRTYQPTLSHLSRITEFERGWIMSPYIQLQPSGGTTPTPLGTGGIEGARVETLDDEVIRGVDCQVLRVTMPESDDPRRASSSVTTLWIGPDGFLRTLHKDWVFGGTRYEERWDYRGVVLADDLADDLFEPWIPDGFEHIHTRADRTEEVRAAPAVKAPGAPPAAAVNVPVDYPDPPAMGSMAPALELDMPDGAVIRLSELRGSPVLLDFWGTWCGPCVMALPALQRINEDYAERGLLVLGVSVHERAEANPQRFLAHREVTYRTAIKGEDAARRMGVQAYPTLFLIDAKGIVRGMWEGYAEEEMVRLREAIERLVD